MKLDTRAIRYLTTDDWRVLTAVEQGSKNHEVVPTTLIHQIAGLRGGTGVHKCISNLAKVGLIGKVKNARYDGYRLTYGGLDYLALNAHRRGDVIYSLGNQIGVGKESDIYITASSGGRQQVLKIHRLGRVSFRTVKANRDYLRNRTTGSWMYLSRLAAQKEYAFMRVLHREGFPVPEPLAWNRHTVVMEFIDAFPLRMIEHVPNPGKLYAELIDMIVELARRGLIHGDFNEFNLLIEEEILDETTELKPVLIDFPQTLSTNHSNAQYYFDRDVECIKRFFERRFKYVSEEHGPFLADAIKSADNERRLDVEVEASGFSRKMGKELERYVERLGASENETEANEKDYNATGNLDNVDDADDCVDEDGMPEGSQPEEYFGESEPICELATDGKYADSNISPTSFGLLPLELPQDRDTTEDRTREKEKKKASGWAI